MPEDGGLDRVLAQVVAELQRPGPIGSAVDQRVLEIIRRRPGPAARLWQWLRTPLTLRVSPLLLATGAAAVVALALIRPGAWSPAELSREAPAAIPGGREPVQFVLHASRARSVHLVGDFNDWDPAATPLRHDGGTVWSVTLPLAPGRYRYTFVVDGREWVADPGEPPALGDDFGRPTSVITVTAGKT